MSLKPVLTMLFIAVVVAGCAPGAPQAPATAVDPGAGPTGGDSGSPDTILLFAVSNMDALLYDSLIDAFEAENPGVHISTVSIEDVLGTAMPFDQWPDDAYLRLAAAADVMAAPATRTAVQQGALLDLNHFFEGDSSLRAEAFYPGVLESVQWDGGTWSLPTEVTYSLLYYDKSLFDAAGLDYPQPGWTWDDFLAAARALTVGSGDAVSQWGFVQPTFDPVAFVQARAGLLFDPKADPVSARLDDAAVVKAVRWYTDLFLTHEVAPYYAASGEGGPGRMFAGEGMRLISSGQAGIWLSAGQFRVQAVRVEGPGAPGQGSSEQQGEAAQPAGPGPQGMFGTEESGVVPFPVDSPGDHSTPATVDGLSISAGTGKADLAWRWISFLAQQPAGQGGPFTVLSTGSLPALTSVAAASGTWDRLDAETAAAMQFAAEHAYFDTYDGEAYEAFREAVLQVMEGGASPEQALAAAQTAAEAVLEEEAAAAPTPVAGLTVVETEQQALDAGAVIIEFGLSAGPGPFRQESMSRLVEEFQAEHPDIIVEVDSPQGFRGGLDLAAMAAEYDCFQATPNLNDESLAAIVNVEPFLAADPGIRKEDFYPSVLEQFVYQGQLWGLPGNVSVNLVNYNRALFDAAGLAYPTSEWTIGDFLQMAVALTRGSGEDEQYGYVPMSSETNDLISILDRLGANLLDESQDPPRVVLNTPEVVDAFRWYTSLVTEYHVQPVFEESDEPGSSMRDRMALIDEGRAGMWLNSGGMRSFVAGRGEGAVFQGVIEEQGAGDDTYGVAPLPAGPNSAQGSGFQSVDGYFISAQSDARQACWTWISYLTQHATSTSAMPARRSVAESAAFRQLVGEERADAYLASVNSGSRPSLYQRISDEGNWLAFSSLLLTDAYERVIDGEATVEEALADAQELSDNYRDCIIANDAFQDMQAMGACLAELDGLNVMPGRQ